MILFAQALPLLALAVLLASGRAGALVACGVALVLALPAVLLALPPGVSAPGALAGQTARGLWLALPVAGIVAGGLLFHAAVGAGAPGRTETPAEAMFTAAFLLGPFAESVTGFGVGAVFAIGMIARAGVSGPPAALAGLMAMSMIPWGGLGPGTALGAALAGVAPEALALHTALLTAPWLMLLLPLVWRAAAAAGHPVAVRARAAQAGWAGAVAALLVGCNALLPWEIAGVLATGPMLALRLWRANPPRSPADWARAGRGVSPYVLLVAALLGSRSWTGAPAWRPWADLPALPVTHVAAGLWLVSGALLVRPGGLALAGAALRRAGRPALTIALYVVLARWLADAGAPQALAGALAASAGPAAPYLAPVLAGLSGFFTGSNVGSNSALMPLQAELGRLSGLSPVLLAAVQNFTGSAFAMLSAQVCSAYAPLAGATPRQVWRLGWPALACAVMIGLVAVELG